MDIDRANRLSNVIIGKAISVHSTLGPGLLERVYHLCLLHELQKEGLHVQSELDLPIHYDSLEIKQAYRVDLLVEQLVIVELKSVEVMKDLYAAQLLTYLKLGKFPLGLLINFNVPWLKNGIKRIINTK